MSRTIAAAPAPAPAPASRALPPPVPAVSAVRSWDDAHRALAEGLSRALVRSVAGSGQMLLREGEPAGRIFIVESGRMDLAAVSETGRACVLDVVGPGEAFGEWALGPARTSPFGAIAAEETRLLSASAFDVQEIARSDPRVARALSVIACARALRFATFLRDAMLLGAAERIGARLADLGSRYGVASDGGVRIDVPLTQEDLARMSGCSRETANRALSVLVRTRRIRVSRRRYVLPRPEPSG